MKVSLALSLMTAGVLLAQPPAPQFGRGRGPGPGPRSFESRLTQNLGLSAEQQNKVHTIMAESRLSMQGPQQKMQTLQASLTDAIKAGDEAKIDQITQEMGSVHQQNAALHAKTMAKIYATLTPDQKMKTGPNLELLLGGPRGGRMGPPPAKQ